MRTRLVAFGFVPLLFGCGTAEVQPAQQFSVVTTPAACSCQCSCKAPVMEVVNATDSTAAAVLSHANMMVEKAEAAQRKAEAALQESEAARRRAEAALGDEKYRACAPFCTKDEAKAKSKVKIKVIKKEVP